MQPNNFNTNQLKPVDSSGQLNFAKVSTVLPDDEQKESKTTILAVSVAITFIFIILLIITINSSIQTGDPRPVLSAATLVPVLIGIAFLGKGIREEKHKEPLISTVNATVTSINKKIATSGEAEFFPVLTYEFKGQKYTINGRDYTSKNPTTHRIGEVILAPIETKNPTALCVKKQPLHHFPKSIFIGIAFIVFGTIRLVLTSLL